MTRLIKNFMCENHKQKEKLYPADKGNTLWQSVSDIRKARKSTSGNGVGGSLKVILLE